jgi:hypothetical protein
LRKGELWRRKFSWIIFMGTKYYHPFSYETHKIEEDIEIKGDFNHGGRFWIDVTSIAL